MNLRVDKITHPIVDAAGISLDIARADLLHPLASGNKIYKLKPHLAYAKQNQIKQLLSFGGAFSNHIHALAKISESEGFSSVGVIRGETEYANNPTLSDVQLSGMHLDFVDRKTYKRKENQDYLEELQAKYPGAFIIPEGGSSQLAIHGCAMLTTDINDQVETDVITLACGTGATFSGVVTGLKVGQSAIGYSVLKDESLPARVAKFISDESGDANTSGLSGSYHIEEASFGGYAKFDETLLQFVIDWLDETGILLDPIYTSKMCMRLFHQIEAGYFKSNTNITMVHTGGLQGWRGMKKQVIKFGGASAWVKIDTYLTQSEKHSI